MDGLEGLLMKKSSPSPTAPARSKKRKSWREKLDHDNGLPKVIQMEGKLQERFGVGTMVVPAPRAVDAKMKKVPAGRLTTIEAIRDRLASDHKTTTACGITTGIFAWIAAHAAAELEADGAAEPKVTPYWRTLKTGGELNAKYPGGVEGLRARLEHEGHEVYQKGKRWLVKGYEERLVRL
jgi:hypothetical protein